MSHLIRAARRLSHVLALSAVLAGTLASGAFAAGTLAIDPEQVDFGVNAFGSNVTRTFVATNGGPDPVLLSDVALVGDVDPFDFGAGSCEPDTVLGVGETCDVEVAFSPLGFQVASYQALLLIAGGDEESATAALTGATQSGTPLTATPTTLRADGTPRTRPTATVQIRNDGGVTLPISYPEVTGPFTLRAPTCGGALAPGATCSVGVALQPPRRAALGGHTGALTVRTLDYGLVVPLTGAYSTDPISPPRTLPTPDYGSIMGDLAKLANAVPKLIRGGPRGERLLPRFAAPATGRLSLTLFGWSKKGRLKMGGGSLELQGWSSDHLGFRLNEKGRALLRRPRRTRVKAVLKFIPAGASSFRRGPEFFVKAPLKQKRKR